MRWFDKLSGKHPRKTRFYHASPHRMPVGTVIRPARDLPQIKPQYNSKDFVYLTTDPKPHRTIAPDIMADDYAWHVYEVVPEGRIWPGEWDDIRAEKAVVVRYVGNAKGLYLHDKEKRKDQEDRRLKQEETKWNPRRLENAPPGTSTVKEYHKIQPRGPYKVKGRQWKQPHLYGPGYERERRKEEKAHEELMRRMYEAGLSSKRVGEPDWYRKVVELFAIGDKSGALNVIKTHFWHPLNVENVRKKLEARGEEIRRGLGL